MDLKDGLVGKVNNMTTLHMNRRLVGKKGFTLIELLIVISIIGLLSTLAVTALSNARTKARDTQRITDIKQIQTALALYYEKNGKYPVSGACGGTIPNLAWANSVQCLSTGRWLRDATTDLAAFFPSKDPIDPKNTTVLTSPLFSSAYFYYAVAAPRAYYVLVYTLEKPDKTIENSDGFTAPDGINFHYGNNVNGVVTVGYAP